MTRRSASTFAFLIAFTSLGTTARAQPVNGDVRRYPSPPWHLVDLWWDTGEDAPFRSYSLDVTVSDDPPADASLYVAPIGLGQIGGADFYGGIQTRLDGHTKADPEIRPLGPGFLLSMWGERSLDAIRPSVGGFCQSSGHEGDFVSVRRPFAWKKGTFTYKVVRMDDEVVDGTPRTWVGAFVTPHATRETVFVGALRFKGADPTLGRKLASFVEVYGRRIPVATIPKLTVTFGNLAVNNRPVKLVSAEAVYPKDVPDYADAKAEDGKVVVTVGRPVEGRKARSVRLLPGTP